jgi:MFS family permease
MADFDKNDPLSTDVPMPFDGTIPPAAALPSMFASLRHRNYRLFFFGQLISLIGLWMHNAAQSWLVYEMTGSKTMLGLTMVAETLPIFLFSTWGGVLADRYPKRKILYVTQSIEAALALILAVLVFTDSVQVWHIMVLAALLGIDSGFEAPARQSFTIEMVGRKDLMNAIGLISSVFHGARIVGPAIAGLVIAAWGTGICFLVNGLSFGALIIALAAMRLLPKPADETSSKGFSMHHALKGFRVVKRTPAVLGLICLTFTVGVFGWSYIVLLPAIAKDTFGVAADGYGVMMSASGVGSVIGALWLASSRRINNGRHLISGSMLLFSIATIIFSQTASYVVALIVLVPIGFGMTTFFSSTDALIQTSVDDDVRGRVMGVVALVWGAMMPLGSLLAGTVAEVLGSGTTVFLGAVFVGCGGIAALLVLPKGLTLGR